MLHPGKSSALAALLSLLLVACSEKPAPAAKAALKVNDEIISTAEVETKLQQYSRLPAEQKQFVTDAILDSLRDMELLRQAAVREKLDVDEAIQARLSSAARLILAEAYITKTKSAAPKPSATEIKAQYDKQPARFAERKLYDLREVNIETGPETFADIEAQLKSDSKLNDFTAWLQRRKLQYDEQPLVVPAEKVLDPILEKLAHAQDGDVITLPGQNKMTVLFINRVLAQPLTLAQATPLIEEQLHEALKTEGMKRTIEQLREQARIEYLPPYQARNRTAPSAP